MLLITVVMIGLAFAINAGPWQDRHGYPVLIGERGATIFFCGAWPLAMSVTLVLGLARKLPGTRRPRAGMCSRCGYDLTGLASGGRRSTCPECGHAARAPTKACPECGVAIVEPEWDETGRTVCPECGVNVFR
jgi:DNA-directed RNA polymerase subunit RPC12/RpoP